MKRLAYALAAVVALAALAVLVAPAFIDTPAVRAEIQRRLAHALDGQITWEALEIGLFPAPHGELRQLRVEIPDKVSVAAEEVRVYLRLWPLLRGSAEISSVTLRKPTIRILAAGGDEPRKQEFDALAAYRKVMEPVAQALRQFAPDTVVRIERAAVDPGELRDLDLSVRTAAEGVDLEMSAASAFWKRASIKARVEYADLAARAQVELDALVLDKDVPPARVRAQLHTDAKSAIECDFDASVGSLAAAKGKLALPADKPPHLAAHVNAIDLVQALALARVKVPGLDALESAEGRVAANVTVSLADHWQAQIAITKSDAAVKLVQLPWKISAHAAHLTITQDHVRVSGARGAVGDSPFEGVAAHIALGKTPRVSAASGRAIVKLEQWFPWLQRELLFKDNVTALSGSVDVVLNRMALRFDRPAELDFEATAALRQVSMTLKALPGPLRIASGSMRFGHTRARYERLAIAMLDAKALLTGTAEIKGPRIEFSLEQGELGEKAVRWALELAGAPARLEPRTPLRFAARRIAWAPDKPLEVDARVDFDGGPALGVALAWRPELLDVRRLTIKDARSDAVLGATVAGDLIQASFSGTLHGHSIPAMLRQPLPADSGTAQGDMRVTIDRKRPERTSAEGKLRIEALDLSWLAGKKALIERAEIIAEGTGGRLTGARFGWEDQFFELRGEGRRTAQGTVINGRIESAGVMLERLLPPRDPNAPKQKSSAIWPLPVTGRVEVSAGFIQHKDYRIEPFDGILSLEPERARLEVKEARMCGVSFPMEVEMQPEHGTAAAHITIKNEPLERTLHCLTGGNLQITGNADLKAELRVQGRRPHLVRGITGTVETVVRQGRVKKFALLGNILSFRGIASLTDRKEEGFPYRAMTAKGRFENGQFLVEESFFDSDAVRLAATGRVDLLGANSQLTVLVGLLTRVDRITGAIPIIGDVFGGSMTALPMEVHGDIRDPLIVPLGPRAITSQLLGIFERTLKLPGKLVVPAPEAK